MAGLVTKKGTRQGANVDGLRDVVPYPERLSLRFDFRVENLAHIRRAYGEGVGHAAMAQLRRMLAEYFGNEARVVQLVDQAVTALISETSELGIGDKVSGCDHGLTMLCEAFSSVPLETPGGLVHLFLSGAWSSVAPGESDDSARFLAAQQHERRSRPYFAGMAPAGDQDWSRRYRADMEHVAGAFAAIDEAQGFGDDSRKLSAAPCSLVIEWQPICCGQELPETLYHEALLRFVDEGGARHSPGDVIGALERLGFVGATDRFVANEVVAELRRSPDVVLGANVSALSLVDDGCWDDLFASLRADPSVAQRLVIEITETAAIPSISDAVRLVDRLRRLGCRIALDGFGAGFASVRHLTALSPDIVKIDGGYLMRAGNSERDGAIFTRLVGLASAISTLVVVEGVETDESARLALEAGVIWQQGYHWGKPGACRRWRVSDARPVPASGAGSGLSHARSCMPIGPRSTRPGISGGCNHEPIRLEHSHALALWGGSESDRQALG